MNIETHSRYLKPNSYFSVITSNDTLHPSRKDGG